MNYLTKVLIVLMVLTLTQALKQVHSEQGSLQVNHENLQKESMNHRLTIIGLNM